MYIDGRSRFLFTERWQLPALRLLRLGLISCHGNWFGLDCQLHVLFVAAEARAHMTEQVVTQTNQKAGDHNQPPENETNNEQT